jgi:hypothetical protein
VDCGEGDAADLEEEEEDERAAVVEDAAGDDDGIVAVVEDSGAPVGVVVAAVAWFAVLGCTVCTRGSPSPSNVHMAQPIPAAAATAALRNRAI